MVTGFEIDGQFIAKEQVKATNRLVTVLERLCKVLEERK